ncbi:MAG: ComEC/Rec2 family competence protein [Xanthobacteraceae bacterium]
MSDYFEIDFLEVHTSKSGDAIAIRYEIGGATYIHVVDGGYQATGPGLAKHIRTFFGNPSSIDYVVVTHPDGDHASGLQTILKEFDVSELWMLRPWDYAAELLNQFSRYTSVDGLKKKLHENYPYIDTLEQIANRRGIPIRNPFQSEKIGAFTVLAPSRARYLQLIVDSDKTPLPAAQANRSLLEAVGDTLVEVAKRAVNYIRAAWGEEIFSSDETSAENEMSVVQYALLCGEKVVLTGDAGPGALTEAADYAPQAGLTLPGVKRFQVPHHGSRRNVTTEILDRWLGPRLKSMPKPGAETFTAIISAAREDEDHPRKAVVRALIHRGARVVSTDDGDGGKRVGKNAPTRPNWTAAIPLSYPEDQEEP